jgi:hypothetical protein
MVSISGRLCLILVIVGVACLPMSIRSQGAVADPVFVGAGDIATCSGNNDEKTALLLDDIPGTIFTAGDNVYPDGSVADFDNCFDPSWGRHKARIKPGVGNHEYHLAGAAGYFEYYGAAAGDPAKGYYSYDLGAWHIIVLNSNCNAIGGCQIGSAQERWLRADLAAHSAACTLAITHHPRFSSGMHGNAVSMQPMWQALYDARADIVISGHDHHYERFAPQNAAGAADSRGIREFVVGTGGAGLRPPTTAIANSQIINGSAHGVLKMSLHPTSYDWEFIAVEGATFRDSGSAACVTSSQQPTPTRTPTPTPTQTSPGSNFLLNWSFETDQEPQDDKPDSWSILPAFTRSNAIAAHHGSFVGRFSDKGNLNHTLSQTITGLTSGRTFSFTGWVNIPAQNDSTFTTRIQVRWLDSTNIVVGTDTVATYTSPTNGWVRAVANPVAPSGAKKARIQVVTSSLNGAIYVDQFSFRN